MKKHKYCMVCCEPTSDIRKRCNGCGYNANQGENFCYNCGTKNDGRLICRNCKVDLEFKRNGFVFLFLLLMPLLPFYKFYAGKTKQGWIHVAIMVLIFALVSSTDAVSTGEATIPYLIGMSGYGVLFIWWGLDFLRYFIRFPKKYTDVNGLPID